MKWPLVRYFVSAMLFFALLIAYSLRVNLSIAIVGMVNHTALGGDDQSTTQENAIFRSANVKEDGPFTWSPMMQGIALSSYYWGYEVALVPGGRVAEIYSCKWVMFFAIAMNVVCAVLTPLLTKLHFGCLLIMRVGQGIGGGVTFPTTHVVLSHWAPWEERSLLSSIAYSGTSLGTVCSILFSGLILKHINWEAVFYVQGGLSALWLVVWFFLMTEYPDTHPCITDEERDYVMDSVAKSGGSQKKKYPLPLKKVVTSPAFLAILVAHTSGAWGFYVLLIEIPFYMEAVLNFHINESAFLATLPFLVHWVFSVFLGKSMDYLRVKGTITTTFARKFCTFIALGVSSVCFLILCFIGNHEILAFVLMVIAVTSFGGMWSGFVSNHIDIAPNFAGTLMAMTNIIATLTGIIVPLFVGALLQDDPGIGSWRTIFFVSIAIEVVAIIIYGIWGSGEVQSWNEPEVE